VFATVTDFLPYFYIAVPRGFQDGDIEPLRIYLNVSSTPQFTDNQIDIT
jgi:hypothetical protein